MAFEQHTKHFTVKHGTPEHYYHYIILYNCPIETVQ